MLSVYEDKNEIAKRKINRMDKILKDKKFIFKILRALLVVVVVFVLILMPFAIENIIYNETTFSFYHLIKAGRDVWFSFIGSYLGAIGTVLLGALALWQTKKYKKASDKTDEIFKILQEKIKELVQANTDLAEENKNIQENIKSIVEKNTSFLETSNGLQADLKKLTESNSELQNDMKNIIEHIPDLIENNSKIQEEVCGVMKNNKEIVDSLFKIQKAIFYPHLTVLRMAEISECGKLSEKMNLEEDAFANVVFGYRDDLSFDNWCEHLEGEYGYFAFPLYNDGEKYIISFNFEQIKISGKKLMNSFLTQSADIGSHQTVWCVFAIKKALFEEVLGELTNQGPIEMDFSSSNTIGETFIWSSELSVTKINEDNPFFSLNYLGTTKIDSLDEWNNGSY